MGTYKHCLNFFLLYIVVLTVVHTQPIEKDLINTILSAIQENNKIIGELRSSVGTIYSSVQENNKFVGELRSKVNWLYARQIKPELEELKSLLQNEVKGLSEESRLNRIAEKISDVGSEWINQNFTARSEPQLLLQFCTLYDGEKLSEALKFLLLTGSDVNITGSRSDNALTSLIKNKKQPNILEAVRILVSSGIDVNHNKELMENALTLFARNRKDNLQEIVEVIKLLISAGIDVNFRNRHDEDVLYILIENYQHDNLLQIVQLLISAGIDVKRDDSLHLAYVCYLYKSQNLLEVIKLLISNGAYVNPKMHRGDNILDILCRGNRNNENLLNIIKYIFSAGFDTKQISSRTLQCYDGSNSDGVFDYIKSKMTN